MGGKKAQAASELISILGVSLLVILLFMLLASKSVIDLSLQQNYNKARDSVQALSEAAESVYAQGEGASRTVFIELPGNTDFNPNYTYIGKPQNAPSSLESKSIDININGTDVIATTSVPLVGAFPTSSGRYYMKVTARGGYVSIYPHLIELDRQSISISMAANESRQEAIRVYSAQSSPVRVDVNYTWAYPNINASISPISFSANYTGTTMTLAFNTSASASGFHDLQLIFNATLNNTLEIMYLPIAVSVQAG